MSVCLFSSLFFLGDLSSNDGFVDMPDMAAPQTPSQHGTYVGSTSPYNLGQDSGGGSMHHFPHFTPDGIPVYPPLGKKLNSS